MAVVAKKTGLQNAVRLCHSPAPPWEPLCAGSSAAIQMSL